MKQVGILGHGVVGSGVVEVLTKNSETIAKNVGEPVRIMRILFL